MSCSARKVDDLDFGITFGPKSASRSRSIRKTPRLSSASSRQPSKTPSRIGQKPSVTRSVRSDSAAPYTIDGQGSAIERNGVPAARSSELQVAKRRTTDGRTSQLVTPGVLRSISEANRVASGRRRVSRPAAIRIAEDADTPADGSSNGADGMAGDSQMFKSNQLGTGVYPEKENQEADPQQTKIGQSSTQQKRKRKRKSIGQQSLRKKKRSSTESNRSTDAAPSPILAEPFEGGQGQWDAIPDQEDSELQAPSVPQPVAKSSSGQKRKKRKSVVLKPRKRRRSSDVAAERQSAVAEPTTTGKSSSLQPQDVRRARSTTAASVKGPKPKPYSEAPAWETPGHRQRVDDDQEADETYLEVEPSPEKPTPKVIAKKTKTKGRRGRGSSNGRITGQKGKLSRSTGEDQKVKKSTKSSFPIVTHRMANVFALPMISEEQEERAEDHVDHDIRDTSLENKFSQHTAPNAVDVLAQICRETIESAVTKVAESNSEGRGSVQRKRNAIEAFGATLDSRLFDMSAALEHRLTLEVRAKRARKEKSDLQAEWLEIRRQREEVALMCDEVRRRHEEMEDDGKAQLELSDRLHELEMVVERETEGEREAPLDFLLKDIAGRVSSTNGGGLLDRVKEFNKHLERTALVLGA